MQWPTVTFEIGFNASQIKTFEVSGGVPATWSDVSPYVLRWGYKRGRQRQLQRSDVGSVYLELDNATGIFDPENASSPYYDGGLSTFLGDVRYDGAGLGMRPGRHLRIRATWGGVTYALAYAYVTAWAPMELGGSSEPVVRVDALDTMGWIARGGEQAIGLFFVASTGLQIKKLLTESPVSFGLGLVDLDDGTVVCQVLATGTYNLLSLIQSYAESEDSGVIFVDGAGRFVFHDRLRRLARERSIVRQFTFDTDPAAQAAGALPFERATYRRDDTDFYNRVSVTRNGGTPQTVRYTTSISRHGSRDLSRSTRHETDADALTLATQLRNRYARLIGQHTSLTVNGARDDAALWPAILGLTISDQIGVVERLYPGGRTRAINSFVEGMQVDVVGTQSWRVTWALSPVLPDLNVTIGGKGVAFPSSPATNDLYFREDLDLLCYWDGTRWLTVSEYQAGFNPLAALPTGAAGGELAVSPLHNSYNLLVTRSVILTYVLTTSDGANYWNLQVSGDDGTVIHNVSTQSDAPSAWVRRATSIAVVIAVAGAKYLRLVATTKVGAPGNIYAYVSIFYRLIIT